MLNRKGIGTGLLLWMFSSQSFAAIMTFTDPTLFNSALTSASATVSLLDFDSTPANTPIADGSHFGGVNFGFTDRGGNGFDGAVGNSFDSTSGSQYLGFNDPANSAFLSGDQVSLGFTTTFHAIGLYVVASPGDFGFANDAVLSAGSAVASNGATPNQTLNDDGEGFFIGLIDTDGFSSAELATVCCGFFEFHLDDITLARLPSGPTTALNNPATWLLVLLAMPWFTRRHNSSLQPY